MLALFLRIHQLWMQEIAGQEWLLAPGVATLIRFFS